MNNNLIQINNIYEITKIFENSKKIIISTHNNPDGDAIGSALALWNYFIGNKKDAWIIISDDVPKNMQFLEGADRILKFYQKSNLHHIKQADLIVLVDMNDYGRSMMLAEHIQESNATKIIIDHHPGMNINSIHSLVDSNASSTGEIIWRILSQVPDFKVTKPIAEALYVAIATDTGNFRFPKTTSQLHRIIAELIDAGADPSYLYENVYNQKSINQMRLLGRALSNLKLLFQDRVCLMSISEKDFRETQTSYQDTEFFVEQTLSIEKVKIGILLSEIYQCGEYKISLRSKDDFDVQKVAFSLGGGGHFNAAGITLKAQSLDDAIDTLLRNLQKIIK
ncbi:MAG TPA: bifunctional oligoribonuclease/PAP phosphatase NrnA [Bacteroidota bacterium]|nr:bifunctional oligoribonuclease/PAP phosphatase NrnA [Bacteroidota bacterium]